MAVLYYILDFKATTSIHHQPHRNNKKIFLKQPTVSPIHLFIKLLVGAPSFGVWETLSNIWVKEQKPVVFFAKKYPGLFRSVMSSNKFLHFCFWTLTLYAH